MTEDLKQEQGCTYLGTSTRACGALCIEHSSYCAEHHPLIYQAGTRLRTRHRDLRRAQQVWDIEQAFNEALEELEDEGWSPAMDRPLEL